MTLFDFKKYAVLTGPGNGDYNFDDSEPNWWKKDDFGSDFNLNDVAVVLLNTTADYAYLKLNGYDTSSVTLGRSTGPIGTFTVDASQTNFSGTVTAPNFQGTINVQSWKGFDIKHPNKPNYRLRHICLEGPEGGVYFRGRLTNSNVINLPDYWNGLIDPETITVSLTQIGYSQDLIVEKIEWGQKIILKSGNGANIDCYYLVNASRMDGDPLIIEYEGASPKNYPGDNTQYSISGYHYDVRGLDG
jgi:hypothetical protein